MGRLGAVAILITAYLGRRVSEVQATLCADTNMSAHPSHYQCLHLNLVPDIKLGWLFNL